MEKQKMLAGQLYFGNDLKLVEERTHANVLLKKFNDSDPRDLEYRKEVIKELFGKTGDNLHMETPFSCDYGYNIEVGENFYANYGCVILDGMKVKIGDNVMVAPYVKIFTATHPIDVATRIAGIEYSKPVIIGNNVWIGGGSIVNPGVTIGDNVVIGSGSVVTKDIPSNVVAAGNPCRIIRELTEEEKL